MQRRDLVNALAKSVIDSSAKEIQVKTEQELDKAVKEKIDNSDHARGVQRLPPQ